MSRVVGRIVTLPAEVCQRAVEARDPRFDGVFFVAVTTTGIYCRPICPSRRANPARRRFYPSAAAAERDHFRPCLRCRPELAPGRALVDAVSRLAAAAADRIAAGALSGRTVASLAADLFVSERHLRRALRRELGVSPIELAQTHRLLLAKRLLADTDLSITDVAYASGFQSLRRFNAVVLDRYRMSPTALRRTIRRRSGPDLAMPRAGARGGPGGGTVAEWPPRRSETPAGDGRVRPPAREVGSRTTDGPGSRTAPHGDASNGRGGDARAEPKPLRLTLAYRPPLAWHDLLRFLGRSALPGVERISQGEYARTVCLGEHVGHVRATDLAKRAHVELDISPSLLPALMPLLARLRRLFDLDAQPAVVEAHLTAGGLGRHVEHRPGLRVPGAFDGFEVALSALLLAAAPSRGGGRGMAGTVVRALGEPVPSGGPELDRLSPGPERVGECGCRGLERLGVPGPRADRIARVARATAERALCLEPGADAAETHRALVEDCGVERRLASGIVMRVLHWPDAFPASDPALQRATGSRSAGALRARAEQWRPWRSYAALHLWGQR